MFTDEQRSQIIDVKLLIQEVIYNSGLLEILASAGVGRGSFFITGGCFVSLLNGEKPNDYDLYTANVQVGNKLMKYLMNEGIHHVEAANPNYGETIVEGKLITNNAFTLKNKFQFVCRDMKPNESIRKAFDYEHCKPFYLLGSGNLYISELQYHLCVNKLLMPCDGVPTDKDRQKRFIAERGFRMYGTV